MSDCIFCKIIAGELPSFKIWEDDKHLAFLSIFPNTEGFTVLVTKEHYPSYFADLPENVLTDLMSATQKVAKLLDSKLEDVGRTAVMFEGFQVDHIHAKLFPMHGTKKEGWEPMHSDVNKYFDEYQGYISSHNGARADDKKLEELAKKINS